jgi:hypothetical protein
MIERRHGHWTIIAGTGLAELARRLGALDDAAEQITRHRRQRAAWHAWLDRHQAPNLAAHELHDSEYDDYWLPPANDDVGWHTAVYEAA